MRGLKGKVAHAAMVAFLFSDDGAYVTGQTVLVDGGANFHVSGVSAPPSGWTQQLT